MLLSLPFVGINAYVAYVPLLTGALHDHLTTASGAAPAVWQGSVFLTQGLNGLFATALEDGESLANVAFVLTAAFTCLVYFGAARRLKPSLDGGSSELMLVASMGLILVLDPHLFAQDIVLALVPLAVLVPHLTKPMPVLVATCLVVDLPLVDLLWPLHLFTVVLWTVVVSIAVATLTRKSEYLLTLLGHDSRLLRSTPALT